MGNKVNEMKKVDFSAQFSYAGEDNGVLMAGLADDQYETEKYVLFQKALMPSREDIELGQDALHVTLSGKSAYNGIEFVRLMAGELRIGFDQITANLLDSSRQISITFDHELAGLDDISNALARMCSDFTDCRGTTVNNQNEESGRR